MADRRREVLTRVYGNVQGVGFRAWARDQATSLGLAGWVRNEADGSVTAQIAGLDEAVSTMIERLWKGPSGASVSRVDVEDLATQHALVGFRIIAERAALN
ncbi:acylphosphatase [Mesorhizobium sp. M7A.T.Ca.TU.009.01.1.1]|nr:acylphosphatase [Mesorhizobium sp. M7A.T.Ca.TU.009.01.1.1]